MLTKIQHIGKVLEKKLKIKPLTKEQLSISLDRLTRFKPTEEKYLRVFKDIITAQLLVPKFSKKQLDLIDYSELTELAQEIINFSLVSLKAEPTRDFSINKKLLEYEKSVFKFDKNVANLLDNKIEYKAAISLIGRQVCPPYIMPCNLKWLVSLAEDGNQIKNREKLALKFPVEKLVLVEGITEEILLPELAKICQWDFGKKGIYLISAGGKNQVVKLFYKYAEILKLPMFVLLDKDGSANAEEIKPKLRKNDLVYILNSGEFEDTLPLNLIKRTLNKHFEYPKIKLDDLRKDLPMTKILEEIFKQRGQEFKKAELASLVAQNISGEKDISEEIKSVIERTH